MAVGSQCKLQNVVAECSPGSRRCPGSSAGLCLARGALEPCARGSALAPPPESARSKHTWSCTLPSEPAAAPSGAWALGFGAGFSLVALLFMAHPDLGSASSEASLLSLCTAFCAKLIASEGSPRGGRWGTGAPCRHSSGCEALNWLPVPLLHPAGCSWCGLCAGHTACCRLQGWRLGKDFSSISGFLIQSRIK